MANLNYSKPNETVFANKFSNDSSVSVSWPPQKEVIPYVQEAILSLIEDEIKDVLTKQLQALDKPMSSVGIQKILFETDLNFTASTAQDCYAQYSQQIFSEIQNQEHLLLGAEDTCGWFGVDF